MSRQEEDTKTEFSPMMTEQGREELYLYSLRKMAEERADSDRAALTGLYGPKSFFFKANECMQQHEKLQYALIRMDIYRFKTVNEFCGRQQGDKLLQYIADCIREYESDMSVVGHLRADIFTICLPFKNKKQFSDFAVALHEKICAYPLFCKALPAFGICISKNHMDISLMCDYADMALQKIKGKAYAIYEFYDDKMRKEMMREKRIENNVAMALRDEEFKVYIQPKVDMRSGEIIGGEALIRWHSVKEGIIYPDEFIPVLEKSGYIVDVDAYVWEKVFAAIHIWKTGGITPVPISVNVSRSHVYQKSFAGVLEKLAMRGFSYEILYLDAGDQALLKRFKETRRSHPLARDGRLAEGIRREREALSFLKKQSDYIIDTSALLTRELRSEMEKIFVDSREFRNIFVTVLSFGFKNGIPADADLVFDVRFLPNPYYVENLKQKTGLDPEVQEYVMGYDVAHAFLAKLEDMVEFLLPNYVAEGKNQLVIAIGCTGGHHRSVTLAEQLYVYLKGHEEYGLRIEHRDIRR